MQICLAVQTEEGVTWAQWQALAQQAERAGLDGLFGADHYASVEGRGDHGSLDIWTVLAGIAGQTHRLRLGTLVSPVTFRHPSVLGKTVATVDHLSHGRAELGLGAGRYEPEHHRYGFAYPSLPQRQEMLSEQLQIIHESWTKDRFTFDGHHYRLSGCSPLFRPLQQPHPPIIVGGAARPRSLDIAVRWADEYNIGGRSPQQCRQARQRIDRACQRHDRDPRTIRLSYLGTCLIGRDRRELRQRARNLAEARGQWSTGAQQLLDELEPGWIAGTPHEVTGHLAKLADAGVQRVYLMHPLPADLYMVQDLGALSR